MNNIKIPVEKLWQRRPRPLQQLQRLFDPAVDAGSISVHVSLLL